MGKNKQVGKQVEGDMIQDSVVIKNTTYDELMKCLMAGDIQGAMKVMEMQEKALGVVHPNYPYYSLGIRRIGDKLVPYSKPLSKEAIEKYPPKIKGKISFSDKYKDFKNINDILDYSYKTQTEIEINNIELMKMIGDEVDPYQGEIELLLSETTEWKLKPKEFPEARPYKVVIEGSDISYDYILLRTTRIEDNKVFLSNREQEVDTEFNFVFDLKNKKITINIKLNQDMKPTRKSLLKYLRFTKSALSKNKFSIISLEYDAVLAEGDLDSFDYENPFGNIDNEITFIEYISLIEEHYNTTVEIPEKIEDDDLEAIYYLGEALKYGEIKGTWKDGTFDFIISEEFSRNIKNLEDKPFDLSLVAPVKVVIFNKEFHIPKMIKTFKNAKMKDLDKVKKKVEVLEDGDVIKVTFVAKGDNQYIEQFVFNEE
ncbi:hypothetical protein [Caldisalinibacter kiritimatiensis]|uniref:Uncharacterized protein n=1 Tax=Caldisalinibacter kiritimatiensis TaxID=1304284 RepID=R1ARP3_9FIRM|nr:hypothetical protein [Caldisalinibacter kiritimatiensis]EOC99341.1 hypothetical protein L21TH_2599 [Caldisalinibacter kiritimatiensis]